MVTIETMQLLVISGVVGVVIGFLCGIPYLKKKGIDVTKVIDTTENVIKGADPIVNAASSLLPNNKDIGILKTIEKRATISRTGTATSLCRKYRKG